MIRSLFISILILIGTYYALQGAFYGLLFYIGNAYFRPEEWVWSDWVRSLHLSLVSGVYVICLTLVSGQKLVWNGRTALLFAFLLQGLLSTLFAEHSDYCWTYWVEFLKVVAITYCVVVLVTDFARFRLVILVMVLSLGLEQGKQGWIYLLTSPGWPNANPVPFLGDNNGTAVGMLMLTPLVGLLAQTTKNKRAKYFYYFLVIGCLYRALSTYSRGGFLAGITMGGMLWLRSKHKLGGGLVAIFLAIGLILPALPNSFWERMGTIKTYNEKQDESALSRLHFWAVAVDMATNNPLLGIGFNGYNKAYDAYDFSGGKYAYGRSVHSSFFGILAELGYPGFFLYLAILSSAFLSCFQVRRLAAQNPMASDLSKGAGALEASLVAFVVGGSFVPLQYNEMLWHVIGLSTALRQITLQLDRQILLTEQHSVPSHPGSLQDHVAA